MREIKNITNIIALSKYDSTIREHATILTKGDRELADDMVQELYIQLHKYFSKYPNKIIDGGLVSVSLRNLIRNYQKYELNRYDRGGVDYEVSFPEIPDDIEDIVREKMEIEKCYEIIEERINSLSWYERKILEYSYKMSLLELSKQSKISYQSLITTRDKINNKLGINGKK